MDATHLDPGRYHAALFDLDGVITNTASVHAVAWKRLFDDYLVTRPPVPGEDHRPFDDADYRDHVGGKPPVDGVLDFLRSRGIDLPRGAPDDDAGAETGYGLGRLADRHFRSVIATKGVRVAGDAVALVKVLRRRGVRTGVVSASRSCTTVLAGAGLARLFDVQVDGVLAEELGLPGRPDPAMFLETARRLGVAPDASVVFEDAEAGVRAARRGGFGLIVGVDRGGTRERLLASGADVVVSALDEITVSPGERPLSAVPDALTAWDEIAARLRGRSPVLLFDFDGTLSPIRDTPEEVEMPPDNRRALEELARSCPVAVVSGRDMRDVRQRVGVAAAWYVGSHGFEVAGPTGEEVVAHQGGQDALPALDAAEQRLRAELGSVPGTLVDRKRFALAVHYRAVRAEDVDRVREAVERVAAAAPALKLTHGRCVLELVPKVDWHKGRAVRWLLGHLGADRATVPLYAGDDVTDEDALREIHGDGIGIVVLSGEHGDRLTWAHYSVAGPGELSELLTRITSSLR
ncbi:hypothetical protein GCM10011581_24770 [Saccharopolyspora subtropica]|uniref:Trehalose 6-phosphate phosphatase n=1 Tax=Saccharopolyspora thermophila TaxID=89367 RepID=A0A917NBN4_9PSEU|nr:trehalose-phosphatase [Saccharopolyspora subtropica]GGI86733.1 hypothetical protein GCM10011581_24770 [Saccharopolyspora subtropica]